MKTRRITSFDAGLGGGETHLPEVLRSGRRDVEEPVPGAGRQLLLLLLLWETSVILLKKTLVFNTSGGDEGAHHHQQTYGLTLLAGGSLQLPPLVLPADHGHVRERRTSAQKRSHVSVTDR